MKRLKVLSLLAAALATFACAGSQAFHEAREEEVLGHWDMAVLKYGRAADGDPDNSAYKIALIRARSRASQVHFEKGKMYRASGAPDLAVVELEQSVVLDPTNKYAESELHKARDEAAKLAADRAGETKLEAMKRRAKGLKARAPMLEPLSDKPVNLNFPTPKPIKQIYLALAASAGINVIFDPQLKDDNVSIVLNNIEFQKALETLMRQENHFYKVIDEKTIMIAADNPQNRKSYEDLVLRTFYLSSGDLTDVSNAIRQLLQTTRISVNKAENSITLRDTADKVAIAERIVQQNDKQLAEVIVDVELLQVNSDRMQDLGLILSSYSVGVSLPVPGGTVDNGAALPAGAFTANQLKNLTVNSLAFTIPSAATVNFIKSNTDAELLAKPQLRISEGQKAQLIIGDKYPIPTTSFNTSTTAGTNIVPITSFQYQDIGIKIDVEPRVHHNKEITLKLTVEVSNLNGNVVIQGSGSQPIIGTRTITSNIRLKDGETNFLAGLFRRDKTLTNTTIPFLGDIPLLGRLFTDKNQDVKTTDLILTLTPHIIRIPDISEEDLAPVYVGTDSNISYQGTPRIESPAANGPFDFQRQQPPAATRPPATTQPTGTPSQNLVPDAFRSSVPAPQAPPPPQPTPPPNGSASLENMSASSAVLTESGAASSASVSAESAPAAQTVFSFDPEVVSVSRGQQVTLLLRGFGDALTADSIVVTFDPSVAAVTRARTILEVNGTADARIERGRVVLQFPPGTPLGGTRAIAELTVLGLAPGRAILSVAGAGAGASSAIEVK